MKIKYKLILVFIIFSSMLVIPFAGYIINKLESESIKYTISQSRINSRIFAKSVLNILMMNGGDMKASRVDVKDMMSMLEPLMEKGLVYADAIILSNNMEKNGAVLASIKDRNLSAMFDQYSVRVSQVKIRELLDINNSYREFRDRETYLEFASAANLPDQPPFCLVRMIISKEKALHHIDRLKIYLQIALSVLLVCVIISAFILGEYISRPVEKLTDGARRIESGDYSHNVQINQSDEIGKLAMSFNHMASMISLKISELEKANEDLKKMDQLKDEFLANTSHELKTPVHGILGLTESMLDGTCGDLNEKSEMMLTMILQSSRRLSKLVNDIVDFSRLKNSDIKLKKTAVDLGTMTDAVVRIAGSSAAGKGLHITNEISPGGFFVYADEDRLRQILLNLIENAVKFTEEGGVTVTAIQTETGSCRIEIADTGIGIPEEKRALIFDSFYQLDGSATRRYGGAGLGLTITRDLVELHGGSLNFVSNRGEGSVFSFTLPLTEKRSADSIITGTDRLAELDMKIGLVTDISSVHESGARVMIVDDDIINLQLLLNQLKKDGYSVTSFTGGEQAIESIESGDNYDVVLLDVMMPVISGYEVLSRIRERFTSHELPVIMLTARNSTQDIITGINLGANDYITKPFDRDVLLARVKSYISLKKAVKEQTEYIAVKQELEIAKKIQLAILPHRVPVASDLSIGTRYEPMREIGGDFYDFLQPDDRRLGVLIADVTGHGVPAALISSMVKVSYYMSADHLENPAMLLEKMNSTLIDHIYGRYITAFYAFIDLYRMKMTFSSAAHWPMYLHNRETGTFRELYVKGKLIGLVREAQYKNVEIDISRGDRLVLFSDGIIEERNSAKERISEAKIKEIVTGNPNLSPEQVIDSIFNYIYSWSGGYYESGLEDDATMVVVDIN